MFEEPNRGAESGGSEPAIQTALPNDVLEDALDEQRRDWMSGKRIRACELLRQLPTVSSDPSAAADLIYHEYLLRAELGERPDWEEYVSDFPRYLDRLQFLRQADRLVEQAFGGGDQAEAATAQLDDYELLEELGHGGMGVVFKARQKSLNRLVALKMIRTERAADDRERRRFANEAEAVARLKHANIVQIYEVGETDGRQFLSLEFVEGQSLAQHLDGAPLPVRQAASLVETLGRALHYAHEKQVIHRDLKPSNVLIAGTLSDGIPKITDFGIAKQLDRRADTRTIAILGTPSYMAPEQIEAKFGASDCRTDVYGLGAILYELITGRPPFRAESPLQTLNQVAEAEPARPRLLNPAVPRDLETICLKCLQKEPTHRYDSAAALADDLDRFTRGEPVAARPVGLWGRGWRWCRRNPLMGGLAVMLALVIAVGLSGVLIQWRRTFIAQQETVASEEQVRQLLGELIDSSPVTPFMDYSPRLPSVEPLLKAAERCRTLLRKRPGDLDARVALTNIQGRLGTLYSQRSRLNEKRTCFAEARNLWEAVPQEIAGDPARKYWLAMTCYWQGRAVLGQSYQAIESFDTAQAAFDVLAEEQPHNLALLEKRFECRRLIWNLIGVPNNGEECKHNAERRRDELLPQVESNPGNRHLRERLALICLALGDYAQANKDMSQAKSCWQQAYDQYKILSRNSSATAADRVLLDSPFAGCCSRLMGNTPSDPYYLQAVDLFAQIGKEFDKLLSENPQSSWLRYQRSKNLCLLILCHTKASQTKKAQAICQLHWREIVMTPEDEGEGEQFDLDRLSAICGVATILWQAKLADAALQLARQAAALTTRYASFPTRDPGFIRRVSIESLTIAVTLRQLNDLPTALQQGEQARRLSEKYRQATPTASDHETGLSSVWAHLAKTHWQLGQRDAALAAFQESTKLARQVFDQAPSIQGYRYDLSRCYDRLAHWNGLCGNWSAVADALRERQRLWPGNAAEFRSTAVDFENLAKLMTESHKPLSARQEADRRDYLAEGRRARSAAQLAAVTTKSSPNASH